MSWLGSRAWLGCLLLLVWSTASVAASPEDSSDTTPNLLAEKLFQEAKRSIAAGRLREGCSKLADSHRLDPAGGTVLLLAGCLERAGALASAWTRYHEAIAFARRDGRDDRAERARASIQELEPRLPRLQLRLPEPRPKGFWVSLDGTRLPDTTWSSQLPVDPGSHQLEAGAPGYERWRFSLDAHERELTRVSVPDLSRRETSSPPKAPANDSSTQLDLGILTLAGGGGALLAGVIAGVTALRWDSRADQQCPNRSCDDSTAVRTSEQAKRAATISNVALGLGAILSVAGLALIWTAGDESDGLSTHAAVRGSF